MLIELVEVYAAGEQRLPIFTVAGMNSDEPGSDLLRTNGCESRGSHLSADLQTGQVTYPDSGLSPGAAHHSPYRWSTGFLGPAHMARYGESWRLAS